MLNIMVSHVQSKIANTVCMFQSDYSPLFFEPTSGKNKNYIIILIKMVPGKWKKLSNY